MEHINLNITLTKGATLFNAVQQLAQLRGNLGHQLAAMVTMIAGADYTGLEAALGLTPGQGVLVYNLTAGAVADLESVDVDSFVSRLG